MLTFLRSEKYLAPVRNQIVNHPGLAFRYHRTVNFNRKLQDISSDAGYVIPLLYQNQMGENIKYSFSS